MQKDDCKEKKKRRKVEPPVTRRGTESNESHGHPKNCANQEQKCLPEWNERQQPSSSLVKSDRSHRTGSCHLFFSASVLLRTLSFLFLLFSTPYRFKCRSSWWWRKNERIRMRARVLPSCLLGAPSALSFSWSGHDTESTTNYETKRKESTGSTTFILIVPLFLFIQSSRLIGRKSISIWKITTNVFSSVAWKKKRKHSHLVCRCAGPYNEESWNVVLLITQDDNIS